MNQRFRAACSIAAALPEQHSPLCDLPVKRLLEIALAHGGKTFRIPTTEEILDGWEAGRVVSECQELYNLWLASERGEDVTLYDVSLAVDRFVGGLGPEVARKAKEIAFLTLVRPTELRDKALQAISDRKPAGK